MTTLPVTVEGTYSVEFTYGFELDHKPEIKIGTAQMTLKEGMVQGGASDLSVEGTYELKQDNFLHMDILVKPPFWDPVKRGDEAFFLRGQIATDSFLLSRPTGDDPRLFVRAKCTRIANARLVNPAETPLIVE